MKPDISRAALKRGIATILGMVLLAHSSSEGAIRRRQAQTPEETMNACSMNWLMRREGSETCWVRQLERDYSFCISKALWRKLVLEGPPVTNCGKWSGRWRIFSPIANTGGGQKELLLRFSARHFEPNLTGNTGERLISFRHRIERARERISKWITPYDPLGVCRHLLLTEKTPGNPSSLLRELGFVHLLTATGIHLYALAAWASWLFRGLASLMTPFGIPLTFSLRAARVATGACWLWAWVLSGGRPGMLRPWIVIAIRAGARALGFKWRKWAPLGIALSADLAVALARSLMDLPGAWAPGRWIYALAVGGGMLTVEYSRGRGSLHQHWNLAIGSWVLVALLELVAHGVAALATPVLSLTTIPLFCTTLYPALLISSLLDLGGFPSAAQLLSERAAWISTEAIIFLFQGVAEARTLWIVPSWAIPAGAFLAAVLAFFSYSRAARAWTIVAAATLSVLLSIAGGSTTLPERSATASRIEQLDVGQGDAALVYSSSGIGMVDSGPEKALSDSSWIRLFAARGINHLHWTMLTHQDEDHSGGFRKLQTLLPISAAPSPFPVLGPRPGQRKGPNREMSAVFIPLEKGGFYLSAGDSSAQDELRVGHWAKALASAVPLSGSRILKVSHHGSRFSTSIKFLEQIQPTQAWISSGAGNSYGHPTRDVLELLTSFGVPISRTDLSGNLLWPKAADARHR